MPLAVAIPEKADGDGVWLVRVTGELDFAGAPRFTRAFELTPTPAGDVVVLDLSELDFLDSSGLGAILRLFQSSRADGSWLGIVSSRRHIDRIFEHTHLREVLGVMPTRDEAVAAARADGTSATA
jgi:anti-anti-sigma factor